MVTNTDWDKFLARINELLRGGWEPLGGVSMSSLYYEPTGGNYFHYAQALTKRDGAPPRESGLS